MGNQKSKIDSQAPLGCLLTNLAKLGLSQDLRPKRLIYFCTVAWPQYELDNVSRHTRSRAPPLLCPLREVAGAEGVVRVHVPFSLSDLSQIEKRLGSFSANPTAFVKEFRYLSQAYDLTWHDIHVILSSTLTSDERERVLGAATDHADQIHLTDASMPVGAQAVPRQEPGWEYQLDTPEGREGRRRRDQMLQCLIAGLQAVSHKVVNFDKLREVTQGPDENPAVFLNRLTEALTLYTRLDPGSPAGATVLATHFISQSAPDIRKKLKKAEDGPQTPVRDLVNMAFKVFNAREEQAESDREARLRQKVNLQTQALVAALRPTTATHGPRGLCVVGVQREEERHLENASSVETKATGLGNAPNPGLQPSPARHAVKAATGKVTAPGTVTGPLRLNVEGPSFQVMTHRWPCWDWLKTEDAQTRRPLSPSSSLG
ncbi:hypothetical protein QTO34_019576 [Cnephaeus nilssonii]|uniref:Core shell protein Gag P30 domain-containing protein n=1 Tax=Cnephaeus nilssonii TaxID=3371016 RepID=A0AA40LPE0_CNENI|nr:hypothetical protein QTO34_019576 [Eptesicus nilssonii]